MSYINHANSCPKDYSDWDSGHQGMRGTFASDSQQSNNQQSFQLPPELLNIIIKLLMILLQQLGNDDGSSTPENAGGSVQPGDNNHLNANTDDKKEPADIGQMGTGKSDIGSVDQSVSKDNGEEPTENKFDTDRNDISIYGDTTKNRMVVMKLSTMEQLQDIPIDGENVYSADYVTEDKSYITPRGSNFVQLLNRDEDGKFQPGKKIALPFAPRTPNRNDQNGLILYSGADKPMFALIDSKSDKLVAVGGRNEVTKGSFDNYDSKWATGHAQWVSDNQFLMPDRENNEVSLYKVEKENGKWSAEKTDSIFAPDSIHTFFGKKTDDNGDLTVLASGEGHNDADNTDANLYELKVSGDNISINKEVNVAGGLHHPGIHPDGELIYAPTSNGKVNIIDRHSFEVVKTLEAGKGAGHVVFVKDRDLALIVNHSDTFMTAINTKTNEKIKDFEVAVDNPDVSSSLQAHTGRVSPDNKYFYNFATDSGTFFRVDLDTLEVDKTVFTGGTPKQASQPGELR